MFKRYANITAVTPRRLDQDCGAGRTDNLPAAAIEALAARQQGMGRLRQFAGRAALVTRMGRTLRPNTLPRPG